MAIIQHMASLKKDVNACNNKNENTDYHFQFVGFFDADGFQNFFVIFFGEYHVMLFFCKFNP